jgi:hypothetical protein
MSHQTQQPNSCDPGNSFPGMQQQLEKPKARIDRQKGCHMEGKVDAIF